MKLHASATLIAVLLSTPVTAPGAEKKECSSKALACDREIRQMMSGRRFLGLTVTNLQPAGVLVQSVVDDSPAERAGFKIGDKVIAVNGRSLDKGNIGDFKQVVADARQTGRLWVIVLRRGVFRRIEVRLEPYTKEQLDKIIAAHLGQRHTASASAGSPP